MAVDFPQLGKVYLLGAEKRSPEVHGDKEHDRHEQQGHQRHEPGEKGDREEDADDFRKVDQQVDQAAGEKAVHLFGVARVMAGDRTRSVAGVVGEGKSAHLLRHRLPEG